MNALLSRVGRPTQGRQRLTHKIGTALVVMVTGGAMAIGPASSAKAAGPHPSGGARSPVSGPVTRPGADHAGSGLEGKLNNKPNRGSPHIAASQPTGLDVSSWQGKVNWQSVRANGADFAYVKATEGTGYTNPYFSQQYVGSSNVGLLRGAYHFALPDRSSGAAQADYFADHGGAWSADGQTLPGALDIEYNPYGPTCYGKSDSGMVSWIRSFIDEYHARTGRWAVIYTTTDWWKRCTGNYAGFASNDPLWIARYAGSAGELPAGWPYYAFWQYNDSGTFPGDQDVFNGSLSRLRVLANNG
ncbi:MAG: lysozyme [Streptosporangiaceae bacterium]